MSILANQTRMAGARHVWWQFSLSELLALMLCVAVLSGLWNIAPQLAVLAAGMAPSFFFLWRLACAVRRGGRVRGLMVGLLLFSPISYAVSVGPAIAVTQKRPQFDQIFDVVYWPLETLCQRDAVYRAANWYLRYWRVAID